MTAPRSTEEVEALAAAAADYFDATGDRPPNISEADWKHILKGAAFAQAIAEVEGRDGSHADGDLDYAGEIEERLRGFGYVVVEAEAVAERDAEVARLRETLWRYHAPMDASGHMRYGDDGELQCSGVDFRRDPVDVLERHTDPEAAQRADALSEYLAEPPR